MSIIFSAMMALLGKPTNWDSTKKYLKSSGHLIRDLKNLLVHGIAQDRMLAAQKILGSDRFDPKRAASQSTAAGHFAIYLRYVLSMATINKYDMYRPSTQ
jgi:hypothetical protein